MNQAQPHYTPTDAAIIWMYLEQYPEVMHDVAVELGYHNPPLGTELKSAPSEQEWYDDLLQQYWLADQPGGNKSGARDARVWLKAAFNTVRTSGLLVDLIQRRIQERREANAL